MVVGSAPGDCTRGDPFRVTYLSAILYFGPSFSSSAMTQSVMVGMHFANRQSIMPWTSSSLFWSEWLIKLVSTRTRYGGPSDGLCDRNNEVDACGLSTKADHKCQSSTDENAKLFWCVSLSGVDSGGRSSLSFNL